MGGIVLLDSRSFLVFIIYCRQINDETQAIGYVISLNRLSVLSINCLPALLGIGLRSRTRRLTDVLYLLSSFWREENLG